jgi:acetyltransferase-like isoleucine patch superfamily enzyme
MAKITRLIKQAYFLHKYRKNNQLGKHLSIARDFVIGSDCSIARDTTISSKVQLGDKVKVGSDVYLSKISIGSHSVIESFVQCVGTDRGNIIIGENTYIGINNYLDNSDNIHIGNFVQIAGPSTALWTHSGAQMCLNSVPLEDLFITKLRPTAPITIGDNVYIGCNCTVYPGITIGHHCIVAPNSAVTKDVPPFTMVGGVPARFIKQIVL